MSPTTIKVTALSIVLFVTGIGVFVFMLLQTQQQGELLDVQLDTISEQRAQEEAYFRLRKIAEESTKKREQIDSYFFSQDSDKESIDFLNMIEKLAPEAGVSLETNSLNLVTDKTDDKQWVEMVFSFTGPHSRVQNFLVILEDLPYVSKITAVDMVASSQTKWQAKVTMRIRVLNYDK